MISRTLRTASVALALAVAGLGASAGTASAGWYPGKFHTFKHHKHFGGWGPGLGLGLGLAAVGAAGAYAAYGDCYVRRVVTVDGDIFYRKVCY